MRLNSKQERIFKLALILGRGLPVPSSELLAKLSCSEPTLSRTLKTLRDTYRAEIKYSKAAHTYQLTANGSLTEEMKERMAETLRVNGSLKTQTTPGKVVLDKDQKTAISLSVKRSVLRKLDRLARLTTLTRSGAVEMLVQQYIDDLIDLFRNRKR
ncbi:tellurium resistance protein TerW [Klebsiella aerogenes]|uniref:tellurium resistance protein TerW n=1 Tax=Klebsiella aerogenes TaxID=548 RepID=UPI00063C4650|nr:tellurium resistance protein TerW [Klebsiella aerogenes]EMB4078978.1 tellurium resistance protein TerW [Klebsiella aerogenes]KLF65520.1 tellurium resistance protein TerW [Klebsiella aerogenes]MDK6927871.1 tellurium resistance protein TerW [Klebsiella aerogenes]HBQ0422250.1 tellurium resistance protein TerW [Klebsiella aerogenes]